MLGTRITSYVVPLVPSQHADIRASIFPLQFQPVTLTRSTVDGSELDPPLPPHIQPAYYAGLVINSFIGNKGSSQIVELTVDDSNVSGYAAYEDGRLARAVFVNLHSWLSSSTGVRPSVHIDLGLASLSARSEVDDAMTRVATATAKRLVIERADDTEGLKWAGQSYETSDVHWEGGLVLERVVLDDGIDLRSTEAVLVEF